MGSCSTSPDRLLDMEVSQEIETDKDLAAKVIKVLVLGSPGSGKSTFFKQGNHIYGNGFTAKDRETYKQRIATQIIEQMNHCIESMLYHNDRLSTTDTKPLLLTQKGQQSADFIQSIDKECLIDNEIASHISILWNEKVIQQIYENRALYQIEENCLYFFDEISRIGDVDNYIPTNEDILYVRDITTGIMEFKYYILGNHFLFVVFEGQQNYCKINATKSIKWQQAMDILMNMVGINLLNIILSYIGCSKHELFLKEAKWIHCFENVTALMFIVSLSCYDEFLILENHTVNSMIYSLQLFEQICNSQWFTDIPIILFLNKKDIFERKIQIVPLSVCFNQYEKMHPKDKGVDEEQKVPYDDAINQYMIDSRNYVKDKFLNANSVKSRQIYMHIVCIPFDIRLQDVFNDVQQIVVSAGLERNNKI